MDVDLFTLDCECGCAAKIPPDRLRNILTGLDLPQSPALLVGPETLDDAGIYKISDTECLVQTVDFFPPVARAPYVYGQIAAANSLSDVYAMGGKPLTAMAVVCFPTKQLGPEVLKEIMRGAVDKLREANTVLLGGHSIIDPQPKYGLSVTGIVETNRLIDNAHARPGDLLILTKPLGTGITIMAVKGGLATKEQEAEANRCMASLNARAALLAGDCGVKACTDITGFGLLGHTCQMAEASKVAVELAFGKVPRLDGVIQWAKMGLLAGATYANRKYVEHKVRFDDDILLEEQDLLFDPQTSGGLLVACPENNAPEFLRRAATEISTKCAVIGRVIDAQGDKIIRVSEACCEGD